MANVRHPAVAGAFYDADPEALRRSVGGLLDEAVAPELDIDPRMLIAPHAGYAYSGPTAAVAYRVLPLVRRLVLVGPAHFAAFPGVAVPASDVFLTPLGTVPVDAALRDQALQNESVAVGEDAHLREHSLEVQLPFLQHVLGQVEVLPLLTGEIGADRAAEVLDRALADDVVAVISSDLSHYLDYDSARHRDESTAAAIVDGRPEDLAWDDACGRIAVQAALLVAERRGWACRLLDLRNSGDTAGSRSRVVGYGAFALGPLSS